MKSKQILSLQEAIKLVKAGDITMWGGFMGCGSAQNISKEMAATCPHKDLTLICNDGGWGLEPNEPTGVSFMIEKKLFKEFYGCHIGLNKELQRQMKEDEIKVNLMPMGSFIEKIRCAGNGLGGVLTPVGLGTEVANGKRIINANGKDYLLELPLHADIAFIKAQKADIYGNLVYSKTARNFNPIMATAASIVVAEVEEIVSFLNPDEVHTPAIFIDYLVKGGKQ